MGVTAPITPAARARVVGFARAQVGDRYQFGGVGPDVWDCSGLVQQAWARAGVALPHQSGEQAALLNIVPYSKAARAKLQLGDVVFWYGQADHPASITHCALFSGRKPGLRQVIAAVDTRHGVMEHWLYWALPPVGFGYVAHS